MTSTGLGERLDTEGPKEVMGALEAASEVALTELEQARALLNTLSPSR